MSLPANSIPANSKTVKAGQFAAIREKLRHDGKKIALCHGVFDLLHPGHIAHLTEAKSLGDVLVVSVTSAPYVNRGPGRPYFSDELRMNSLAALSCVDYVLLAETPTALEMIDLVQPDYYVKGKEYAVSADDVTGNIDKEVEQVRAHGGDIYFTGGVIFSSTKLINQNFSVFPPGVKEFCQDFGSRFPFEKIREIVERMRQIKVMVVGDIIIDEYVFCVIQGLTSKDRAYSARYLKEDRYLGGTLAVARHLANFSDYVTVCSMVGNEGQIHSRILNDLSAKMRLDLEFDPNFRTVTKRRFVERRGMRDEYEKIFSVNYLSPVNEVNNSQRNHFYERLERDIQNYDMVVIADYGHGLIDERVMEIVQEKAKYLAVNCQTNSSNYGTNLITKYKRADMFSVDDRELHLAQGTDSGKPEALLQKLVKRLQTQTGWVTRGSFGSIAVGKTTKPVKTPALTLMVQDTVGAGDAFYAVVALAACQGEDLDVSSFLGNIAGALAANILGNSQAVEKGALLKFASTLLKF